MTVKEKLDALVGVNVTIHDKYCVVSGTLERFPRDSRLGVIRAGVIMGFYSSEIDRICGSTIRLKR